MPSLSSLLFMVYSLFLLFYDCYVVAPLLVCDFSLILTAITSSFFSTSYSQSNFLSFPPSLSLLSHFNSFIAYYPVSASSSPSFLFSFLSLSTLFLPPLSSLFLTSSFPFSSLHRAYLSTGFAWCEEGHVRSSRSV